jgi:hypothetical protein
MLVRPHLSGHANAGLHFIDDQHRIIFVGKLSQHPEEFRPEVIVASLALDRLDDDRRDVVPVVMKRLLDLSDACLLVPFNLREVFDVQRKCDRGVQHARPGELREQIGFRRIGIRQRQCVPRPPVEALAEVDHLASPFFAVSLREVFPDLPVERRFQSVLHTERPAFDEERVGQVRGNSNAGERLNKLRLFRRVDIGERRLIGRNPGEFLLERGSRHFRVVQPDG